MRIENMVMVVIEMFVIKKIEDVFGLIWLLDIKLFEIGLCEVLVVVMYVGICGIDWYIYEWDVWSWSCVGFGMIMGYEFVGNVVLVGGVVCRVEVG